MSQHPRWSVVEPAGGPTFRTDRGERGCRRVTALASRSAPQSCPRVVGPPTDNPYRSVPHDDEHVARVPFQDETRGGNRDITRVRQGHFEVVSPGWHDSRPPTCGRSRASVTRRVLPGSSDIHRREGDRPLDNGDACAAVRNWGAVEGTGQDQSLADDQVVVVAGGSRVDRVEDGVVEARPVCGNRDSGAPGVKSVQSLTWP